MQSLTVAVMSFHLVSYRLCGATDDSYMFAYVNDLDAPELNTLPSNRVALPSNHGNIYCISAQLAIAAT